MIMHPVREVPQLKPALPVGKPAREGRLDVQFKEMHFLKNSCAASDSVTSCAGLDRSRQRLQAWTRVSDQDLAPAGTNAASTTDP
jgi:hypothetical protein